MNRVWHETQSASTCTMYLYPKQIPNYEGMSVQDGKQGCVVCGKEHSDYKLICEVPAFLCDVCRIAYRSAKDAASIEAEVRKMELPWDPYHPVLLAFDAAVKGLADSDIRIRSDVSRSMPAPAKRRKASQGGRGQKRAAVPRPSGNDEVMEEEDKAAMSVDTNVLKMPGL